jgi:transcriptional regulator with XRE-family HTH domain
MKVNVDLMLRLRKDQAWSQEELALAAGLNLRTIQRIEKEATASLQSMKALASAFEVNIRALEYEESAMLNELVGKEVVIVMGISVAKFSGADTVKGKIVAIDDSWLKLAQKKEFVYINISQIKRIVPQ